MRATISGTVQGVGFRWFAERELDAIGVCGTVRNLPDRCVEVIAEGSPDRIEQALSLLGIGPAGARVTAVEVEEIPTRGFSGFEILR